MTAILSTSADVPANTVAVRRPLPLLGTRAQRFEALRGMLLGTAITAAYVVVAGWFGTQTTNLEIVASVTALACVWLVRTENVWTMPIGIVSCVLMGWFFFQIELVGQAWLQIVFYIPVQFIGWWVWCRGGAHHTELPPTRLTTRGWVASVAAGIGAWLALWAAFHALYGPTSFQAWDASVVAASVVAQMLMMWKKAEHWLVWLIPVNVSAIGLYAATGSWAFAFLYVVYLGNAAWGYTMWRKTIRVERDLIASLATTAGTV